MADRKSGNPDVIDRNHYTPLFKVHVDIGITNRSAFIIIHDQALNPELANSQLLFLRIVAFTQTTIQLTQHGHRQPDFLGKIEALNCTLLTTEQADHCTGVSDYTYQP